MTKAEKLRSLPATAQNLLPNARSASVCRLGQTIPLGQGFDAVQIAGDTERRARVQRAKDGIVIDNQTCADIVAACAKMGVNTL